MTFGQRLVKTREKAGLNQRQLAALLGITPTRLNYWEKDKRQPDVEMIRALASTLDVSADYLIDNKRVHKTETALPISDGAMRLAKDYDVLDRWGQKQVRDVADNELSRMEDESRFLEETALEPEPKLIPLFFSPAAAGIASPILGSDYDDYTLKPDDPQGAMFAIKVQGDSMSPHFPDGSIAFCNRDPLQDGDIGVFSVDGSSVIKQYHYDRFMGMTYLFSLNRNCSDADVLITSSSGQTLVCFGRVITKRRYPLPR